MIIGTVIGAGIYILIGSLAVEVGPGLFISYFIALVVAVSSSLCFAQIATIYPVTAGTYKYVKMFFTDYTGFIIGWLRLITGFYGLTLMATGFTEYVNTPFGVSNKIIGIILLFIFFIINWFGIQTTEKVQRFLVSIVTFGLIIFTALGIFEIDIKNLIDPFRAGTTSLIKGSMTAFFAYTGMYFVAEIGDEIKNPHRNIPLSIIIASIIIGILYITTSLVFSGGLGWGYIKANKPNLVNASSVLFNPYLTNIIKISAIIAVVMPINSIFAGASRLAYSLSDDGYLPEFFSRLNKSQVPGITLIIMFVVSSLLLLLDMSILYIGTLTSIVTLISMALIAVATLKIKFNSPDKIKKAPMKLPSPILYIIVFITIIAALILSTVSMYEDPMIFYALLLWIAIGSLYYFFTDYLKS